MNPGEGPFTSSFSIVFELPGMPTPLTERIPIETLRAFRAMPLEENAETLTVGLAGPAPDALLRDLSFLAGKTVMASRVDSTTVDAYFEENESATEPAHRDAGDSYRPSPASRLGEGSVVQQVNHAITRAIEMGASDIHVEPYEACFRVRYRLDGVLQDQGELALRQREAITSRLKIMAGLDIAEKRRPQDGRIRFERGDQVIDLRVSTLPTDFGEKVVLRILDKSSVQLELETLGFSTPQLELFRRAINQPYGMILVTGPTGSGKTTTLYAALNAMNTPAVNITTIEDPIEYHLHGINQTHVRADIGVTFAHALRAFLRQDPNIIMVGEMRDSETVEIAIRAALTGHLVLSTLHTNDAPSTLTRLTDMGVEPFLVASSVRLVIAQRLVRRICAHCKEAVVLDRALARQLGIDKLEAFRGAGCERCHGSGYKGRTALLEIMPIGESLAELIADGASTHRLRSHARTEGMQTLREAAVAAFLAGITTAEEVLRETSE